jgi:tRNA pseudouridine32 synthase/23S rRNA pseudouridine746 synthase
MDQFAGIQVILQDPYVLVINKPAGLATLPDGYDPTLPHIKSILQRHFGPLWIVHRLDKETSGVLLLARTADAHRKLNSQFEQHLVAKRYHALVVGSPQWEEKIVDLPLRPNGDRQHRTVIDLHLGKPATTHFKLLERFRRFTLLEAIPETGRTHQIRAHLSFLGLYIIGDKLYKPRQAIREERQAVSNLSVQQPMLSWGGGMALHAISLAINHPNSGQRLEFTAPYPQAWTMVLQQLRSSPSAG